ncbi:hypothetical protein FHS18_003929 [Paenibacillus phyllosphaerae]|uniref:Uncharacterized protein n=1 Tax=Paenibacillus phyllosphaerae TaxID=274593 RepID=A0A7W5B1A5_9BACL|nr:hypothetical protein [Paenibacillus phyllosphaerae]MBB3111861.1 hypothetical protein [Paenibacillus phyllosphaerae]
MIPDLFHYYDAATGPFRNLSDLSPTEAQQVMRDIRKQGKGFASQRAEDYLEIRRRLESKAREMFLLKGGKPVRVAPHYMTVGECPWLLTWYENGQALRIPAPTFDPCSISFTYGDLFPTMRVLDSKPYRGQVYTLREIKQVIDEFGLPQEWNYQGEQGPERYIEVQVWDDFPLASYLSPDGQ